MAVTYTTLRYKEWKDFKNVVNEFSENWAFRGQLNTNWILRTAIERTDFIHLYKGIESNFVAEFQRGARNYLSRDETPEHLIEWLALMQHHGAPTRLLDFSRSPYIAAYFSFEACNIHQDEFIAVWAINMDFLKKKALEKLKEHYKEEVEENKNIINGILFSKVFYDNEHSLIFPVEPFRMNRRYSVQQSIFVCTGKAAEPFMQQLKFLGDDIEKAVIKIELPSVLQKEVLRDLQKMNLNRASLFPDLDGYASALRIRYNSMKTPAEAMEQKIEKLDDKGFKFFL